jgi:putative heme-binding domain-containing protein
LRAHNLTCVGFSEGCRPTVRKQVSDILLPRFPANDERLNRELARTLAYSGQPEAIGKILAAMPAGEENQQLQIHYAYCLRSITNGWTKDEKKQLLSWFGKARNWRGGASFPGFINRIFDSSLAFFDAAEKKQAYAAIPEYAPIDPNDPRVRRRGNYTSAQVFTRKRGVEGVSEQEVFEFMMYDPMTTLAKAEDGEAIFKEICEKCHRFGDKGKDYGPDLTTINNRFKRRDLVEAVLWPSKVISDQYEAYIVETKNNESYLGMIASEDDEKLVLNLPEEDRPLVLRKSDIKEKRVSQVSTMPDGLLDPYSTREIAALFKYMQEGAPAKQAAKQ